MKKKLSDTLVILSNFADLPQPIVQIIEDLGKGITNNNKAGNKDEYHSDKLKTYIKISILKSLAWRDRKLDPSEVNLINDYILNKVELPHNEKENFIKDLTRKPDLNFIKKTKSSNKYNVELLFSTSEEAKTFKQLMLEVAAADGDISSNEHNFINSLLKQIHFD